MESMIPAILDGGSTVVIAFLLMWMIMKLPEKLSRAFDRVIKQQAAGMEKVGLVLEKTNQSFELVLDKHMALY